MKAQSPQASHSRQAIAETLRALRSHELEEHEREQLRREAQDEYTKSVVKIMHLDSSDFDRIADHARVFFMLLLLLL